MSRRLQADIALYWDVNPAYRENVPETRVWIGGRALPECRRDNGLLGSVLPW
jgi:hypothetical protein